MNHPVKVLLVTTDARIEADVRSALMGEDNHVLHVATPQRALAYLCERPNEMDIVVADADTAPTGGFALSWDMKAHDQMGDPMPPIVLLIARDDDRWMAKWSRADAFIRKPVDPFDLDAVVRAVVAGEEIPELPRVHAAESGFEAILAASKVVGEPGTAAGSPITAGP
jgi:DNA-binding response OmpR family regulator